MNAQPGDRITVNMAKVQKIYSVRSKDYTTSETNFLWIHNLIDINNARYSFINKNPVAMEGENISIIGTVKGYVNNGIMRLQRVKILQHHSGVEEHE